MFDETIDDLRERVIREHGGGDTISVAFSQGSDARLLGMPTEVCPYDRERRPYEWRSWQNGWRDVNYYWGKWAPGRCRPLPEVRAA